jgi:beta-catenin-like protein 1
MQSLLTELEQALSINSALRAQYSDNPSQFLDSEISLADALQRVEDGLVQQPGISARKAAATVLVEILAHDNLDISTAALRAIHIIIGDRDVVGLLVELHAVEILVQNLQRLDQSVEEDLETFDQILGMLEIMVDLDPGLADKMIMETELNEMMIRKIEQDEDDEDGFDELQL